MKNIITIIYLILSFIILLIMLSFVGSFIAIALTFASILILYILIKEAINGKKKKEISIRQ